VPPRRRASSARTGGWFGRLARRARRPQVALLALLLLLIVGYAVRAAQPSGHPDQSTVSTAPASLGPSVHAVALSSLPGPAQHTVALIRAGGPFPYSRDGIVFRNAEHELPAERSGYYHEYTVPTPGESDRGARRIIAGIGGEYFYTANHYASFVRIDPSR
jgi:ribonuclease T1